jgi:hypothetical protein
MNKKILLPICLLVIVMGVVAFNSRTQSKTNPVKSAPAAVAPKPAQLPEHVPYMFLFRRLKNLEEQNRADEQQGKRKSGQLKKLYEELSITDDEAQVLLTAALECERQLAVQDEKAQVIIDNFRARNFPNGEYNQPGPLPPPPPELEAMQQERNAIILRARDRLRRALGEERFAHLHEFVMTNIASGIYSDRAQ